MATVSIIIATRNRPALFAEALASVLRQSAPPEEVVVVNDGSEECHQGDYALALDAGGERVKRHTLTARPQGHGPSYALNFGVAHATGDYVGFLDDDDRWTDDHHLERARAAIASAPLPVDLYMTNQAAFLGDVQRSGPIWIEELEGILHNERRQTDASGAYSVTVDDLLRCTGFCHLNTLIVRRALYDEIGGMDEGIRWEGDRDLYLRLIDRARLMLHSPRYVSRHNIPNPSAQANVTTALSDYERRLYQLRVVDRAALFASHAAIRNYGHRHKAFTLKKIAETLAHDGRHANAAFYAREALGAGPTLKWAIYTVWRMIRGIRSP
jgi:glycosyltransferase involved in cell wall biosynthesis